jgi:arginyl-tRNA synthetase
VYDRLDVKLDEFGESFYNDKIPPVITELEKNGQVQHEDGW